MVLVQLCLFLLYSARKLDLSWRHGTLVQGTGAVHFPKEISQFLLTPHTPLKVRPRRFSLSAMKITAQEDTFVLCFGRTKMEYRHLITNKPN